MKCRWCGKSTGIIKLYIIADDMENPKPYHPACIRELDMEVIRKLSDIRSMNEQNSALYDDAGYIDKELSRTDNKDNTT